MNNDADSVAACTDFAGQLACHVPHANRYLMARAWLLLPALWAARSGTLDAAEWRAALPTQFGDPGDERATDVRVAAIELAETDPQPWESGGPDALNSWYDAAMEQANNVYGHWALVTAAGVVNPDHPWSEKARQASHAVWVMTEASFLAAGGNVLRLRHGFKFSQRPAPPKELSPGDTARVFARRPPAWLQAQRLFGSFGSRIDDALAAQAAEASAPMARARLAFW